MNKFFAISSLILLTIISLGAQPKQGAATPVPTILSASFDLTQIDKQPAASAIIDMLFEDMPYFNPKSPLIQAEKAVITVTEPTKGICRVNSVMTFKTTKQASKIVITLQGAKMLIQLQNPDNLPKATIDRIAAAQIRSSDKKVSITIDMTADDLKRMTK